MKKIDKIKTSEMYVALTRWLFNPSKTDVISNVSWGLKLHECDLLSVTKSGYATEVEIKISLADLKADAKKRHHHRSNKIKYLFFAIPDYLYEKAVDYIPERAGIITIKKRCDIGSAKYTTCIKRTPQENKNCRKFTDEEIKQLRRLGAMRYWTLLKKVVRDDYRNQQKAEKKTS